MTLQQAIYLVKFHRDWERCNGDGESPIMLISLDEAYDKVLWAANQYIVESELQIIRPEKDTEPSPSRPQESDTEPKGVFYEAKQAALDYIQKAKDGPTPEPFMPKEGDVLIAIDPCVIETIGTHEGKSALTVNKEYRVMEDYGSLIVVINDFAERHEFTLETIHKYFKRKE